MRGEERVGAGRVRGTTVVGLSDVGARCAASGLQVGGEQLEKGDTAEAAAGRLKREPCMKEEQTTSVREPGHPGPWSPRYWGVSFLDSFFIPRETANLFSISVAEGGVAMESVAVGTGSSLVPESERLETVAGLSSRLGVMGGEGFVGGDNDTQITVVRARYPPRQVLHHQDLPASAEAAPTLILECTWYGTVYALRPGRVTRAS